MFTPVTHRSQCVATATDQVLRQLVVEGKDEKGTCLTI
jgi:hypothetical protein